VIEASLADYYIAKELFERAFFQSLYGVHPNTKKVMEAIKQMDSERKGKSSVVNLYTGEVGSKVITTKDLMKRLGWTRKKIFQWAEPLEDIGWMVRTGERQPSTFEVGTDPIGKSTLPPVEALADAFPDLAKDCNLIHPLTGEELSLEHGSEAKAPGASASSSQAVPCESTPGKAT
jgi:hypothetical protein